MNKRKTGMRPRKPSMKKLILIVTVILTVLVTALLTAHILMPLVYDVDIGLSSSCTLADAIIAANNDRAEGGCPAGRDADIITLTQDITLDGGLPKITSDITIEGNGYAISGDNRWRIFYNAGGALTIHNLTMTKGYVEGELITNSAEGGGAVVNWQGTVTISGSSFSDNSAEDGGAVYNKGTLTISSSGFSGNSARNGGAIYNEGGELSIVNSTFSDNSADFGGGAVYNGGELSIVNSTFSDNSAIDGGAIDTWKEEGKLRMTNSIIAGRSSRSVIIIIGGNACRSRSELEQNISNFIQDGSCSPAFSGDPKLGALVVPEDGSPAYFPLLAGSPAIDAADDDYCPEIDQIGTVRSQGAGCDIGAIEYAAP